MIKPVVNTNNDFGNTIIGPHTDFGHLTKSAGIYFIPPSPIGGYPYTMILTGQDMEQAQSLRPLLLFQPVIPINCGGASPNVCAPGIVYGPAITSPDATFGEIFTPVYNLRFSW
jgi:hypothetical protein